MALIAAQEALAQARWAVVLRGWRLPRAAGLIPRQRNDFRKWAQA